MASIAELNSRVFLELQGVQDYLTLDSVHNAVVQAGNVRITSARNATTNVLLSTSEVFQPTTMRYDITYLIGKGTPEWIEYQAGDYWLPIRVVNDVSLSKFAGTLACSFYTNDAPLSSAVSYVQFSNTPSRPCRIRFSSDSLTLLMAADNPVPENVSQLVVLEAQNALIPRIKISIAANMGRDEKMRQDLMPLFTSLSELYGINAANIAKLLPLWKQWAYRSRGADNPANNPTPHSAAAYPGWRDGGYGNGYGGGY